MLELIFHPLVCHQGAKHFHEGLAMDATILAQVIRLRLNHISTGQFIGYRMAIEMMAASENNQRRPNRRSVYKGIFLLLT